MLQGIEFATTGVQTSGLLCSWTNGSQNGAKGSGYRWHNKLRVCISFGNGVRARPANAPLERPHLILRSKMRAGFERGKLFNSSFIQLKLQIYKLQATRRVFLSRYRLGF